MKPPRKRNSIASAHTSEARSKAAITNKGKIPWHAGKKLSKEHKANISKAAKGRIRTPEHNKKLGLARSGEKSHFWKGGIAAVNANIRWKAMQTSEYRQWRRAVLERDKNTCQHSDSTCSGYLHVDHIKAWKHYPELRLDIDNGRVLCEHHHKQTDTFAGRVFKNPGT